MTEENVCPDCRSALNPGAVVCSHCGERAVGKSCPDCQSRVPETARTCRWCGFAFAPPEPEINIAPFTIRGAFIPTIFIRGRFLVQSASIDSDKLIFSTPGIFGLTTHDEEIPWTKVAGFDYRSGIFWDLVRIETRGQKSTVMSCLSKNDGKRFRDVLRQLKE